jgi:hypothetical protein
MKKIISKIALAGLVACSGMVVTSCNDELDLNPIDYFSTSTFWKDKAQFTGTITAQANMFRSNYPANILFYAGELRAGTLTLNTIDGSGILNSDYIQNIYDSSHTQFSNMGNYYGFIANCNELIYQCDNAAEDLLDADTRDGLKAMAYGWRAFCLFQMYRMYGGVVIRTEPDVTLGNYEPTKLYKARSTSEETLAQIKSDIAEALKLFDSSSYTFSSGSADYYWSKAATEMLAGEVYLWSGKVSTGNHKATPADVATAKQYFLNVANNYGKSLVSNYYDIWTTPHSSESIYSMCYTNENDASYYTYPPIYFLWSRTTGAGYNNWWSTHDKEGWGHNDGTTANRFGKWYDPTTMTTSNVDIWQECSFGPMRYMYKNALYFQFDEADSRTDMWYPCWSIDTDTTGTVVESKVTYLENFDYKTRTTVKNGLAGAYVCKVRPGKISSSTYYTFKNDMPIYRLAETYLYLAECYNYEGNNTEVEKYINLIRQRAYGDNWDETKYGYKAGTFADNESAILHEKDKEFIMEGTRWFDLVRLAVDKSGDRTSALAFQPQGCVGYGLDVANSPWMIENDGTPCETTTPVLTPEFAYKVLWPIDATLLNSDTELKQNPGYADSDADAQNE